MNKTRKILYVTAGLIAFCLGAIGVILPVLPTTPFLLLASYCFAKGSEKFNTWFVNTGIYKKHLESFVREKSMTVKQKVSILVFADTMIAIPFITIDNLLMRICLIIIVLFKLYYFIFKIKTIESKKTFREG